MHKYKLLIFILALLFVLTAKSYAVVGNPVLDGIQADSLNTKNLVMDGTLFGVKAIDSTTAGTFASSGAFITSETDPHFATSNASSITNSNITNWNTVYSWGNHASVGYLTSYTELDPHWATSLWYSKNPSNFSTTGHVHNQYLTSFTELDPIFNASQAAGITLTNINNWNTAFGWGNHASAGYLTSYIETDPHFATSIAVGIISIQVQDWDTTASKWKNRDPSEFLTSGGGGYLTSESDPIFSTSAAQGISNQNIIDWNSTAANWENKLPNDFSTVGHIHNEYLTSENDPVFSTSIAHNITNQQTSEWSSSYSWGNHAEAGYLTSFTELDPVFTSSAAYGIVTQNLLDWQSTSDLWMSHSPNEFSTVGHVHNEYLTSYSETDPHFATSNASTISSEDLINWDTVYAIWGGHNPNEFITTESDPVFSTSIAKSITTVQTSEWASSYSWGNHANAGYLTSYTETDPHWATSEWYSKLPGDFSTVGHVHNEYLTSYSETDPVFETSIAKNITSTQTSEWQSAYGWGNHATSGYLTSYVETDPHFSTSLASGITDSDLVHWNTVYNIWGSQDPTSFSTVGHVHGEYLTSESDPIFQTSIAQAITAMEVSNWNTAYGWGDHASKGYLTSEPALSTIEGVVKDPTGFLNRTSSTLTFDPTARWFTISPISSFDIYSNGNKFTKSAPEAIQISTTTGMHYVTYNSAGSLVESTSPWAFSEVQVATIYWNNSTGSHLFGDERHGFIQWQMHEYMHNSIGTRYANGFSATTTVLSGGSPTDDRNSTITYTGGDLYDEDLKINIVNAASPSVAFEQKLGTSNLTPANSAKIPMLYRLGATGDWTTGELSGYSFLAGSTGTCPYWNQFVTGAWQQTAAVNGDRIAYFVYATNNPEKPIIGVMGQRIDSSLANAQNNNTPDNLALGTLPASEMKLLHRVIYQCNTAWTNATYRTANVGTTDYRAVTPVATANFIPTSHGSLTGLTLSNQHPATSIYTDTTGWTSGTLTSSETDAQLALNKLNDTSINWNTAFAWGNHSTKGYLTSYTETDPGFNSSAAKNITAQNITDWNTTSFYWATKRPSNFLTSGGTGFVTAETDPIFNGSAAKNIAAGDITNWNTSYYFRITSAGTPISISSNAISMTRANGSTNGWLSSEDWTTFNSKEPAIVTLAVSKGGTGIGTYTSGAMIYASGTGALSQIAPNLTGTVKFLKQTSAGLPLWDTVGNAIAESDPVYTASAAAGVTSGKIANWDTSYYFRITSAGAPLAVNTNVLSIPGATSAVDGYLKGADWTTFNNKQNTLTTGNLTSSTTGVTISNGTGSVIGTGTGISISMATSGTSGLLSGTDWSTFNSKEPAITTLAVSKGGTGIGTYTSGAMIYASGTGILSQIAPNASATEMFLKQSSSGLPAWSTVTSTASGANTSLSNLVTVAINDDLVPQTNSAINLGSTAKIFKSSHIGAVYVGLFTLTSDAITDEMNHILADASGGSFKLTLPDCNVAAIGRELIIDKIDTSVNKIIIDGNSTDQVFGTDQIQLEVRGDSVKLRCNGSNNWY